MMELHEPVTPLTPSELRAHAPEAEVSRTLTVDLVHANLQTELVGESMLPGKTSYFRGSDQKDWITNVPTYGLVRYSSIYPGVDLSFYGNAGRLEYDFRVAPGASAAAIELAMSGADAVRVDDEGSLVLTVRGHDIRFLKPLAYQEAGRTRQQVSAAYRVSRGQGGGQGGVRINFDLGNYDRSRPLIIDPVLDYGTYLPLYNESAMTTDSSGNVYVTGPDPSNPQFSFDVLKYSAGGTLLYTAIVTDSNGTGVPVDEFPSAGYPTSIAVDANGKAYVGGGAGAGWPTTAGAYQGQNPNPYSPYAVKLNAYLISFDPTGTVIEYATYLGEQYNQPTTGSYATAVAVDNTGDVYVTGSASTGVPTTAGAYQTSFPYGHDTPVTGSFIAKFDPTVSGVNSLIYSTLWNWSTAAIAADSNGNAYVTGGDNNNSKYVFPVTPGAYDNPGSIYVSKFNANGTALVYSAMLGNNYAGGIAVDGSGDAYVTGKPDAEFPTTRGAYQVTNAGGFVAELNPSGSGLVYSTFLGGLTDPYASSDITPSSIMLPSGCLSTCSAYVAGVTVRTDLPLINAIQIAQSPLSDAFVVELDGTGNSVFFSTYIGGLASQIDEAFDFGPSFGAPAIGIDTSGNIYLAGNITAQFSTTI